MRPTNLRAATSPDPAERLLHEARPEIEGLLRRHGVPPAEAGPLLASVLPEIESPRGLVPGATQRLLKSVEAGCRRRSGGDEPAVAAGAGGDDYDDALKTARRSLRRRRRRQRQEQQQAPELLAELERSGGPPPGTVPRRLRSQALVILLLDRCRDHWTSDPATAATLAEWALLILDALDPALHGRPLLYDLEARAWAYLGNTRRLGSDLRAAERAFEASSDCLERGSQDPRERADLLALQSTLRRAQRRFPEALRMLQQAAAIYRWLGNRHAEGKVIAQIAIAHSYSGHPELAVPKVRRALELIDPEREPRLSMGTRQNLANYLHELGRSDEARAMLPELRRQFARYGSPGDHLRLRWLEGRLELAAGDSAHGEAILTEVREAFVASGNGYDAALVSLELVARFLEQGRGADARRLAEAMLSVFHSLEVHREALAALIALERAARLETASVGLVREVAAYLQRLRSGPPPRPEKPS